MNLEEKIKEVRKLSENLWQSLGKSIYVKIVQKFPENENYVCIDAHPMRENFNIDDKEEYNDLINFLNQHQKQPELYTLDEIERLDLAGYFKNSQSKKAFFDLIKNHAKPYKKQS